MTDNPFILPPIKPYNPWRVPFMVLAASFVVALAVGSWLYLDRGKANTSAEIARQDLKASQAKIAALEADKTQLETEKAQLEAEKAQLETDKAQLETDKRELSKSVQVREGELAELKGISDKIQDKMKFEIADGDIQLEQSGGKLRVGLGDKILFESGETQISKRGEGVLARVAEVLAGIPDQQIQVSGHTDRAPISSKLAALYPTTWELSVARATNVVRFLAEKANVPPQQLVASGYGEYQPIANNKSQAGRVRNRRTEIILTPMPVPETTKKSKHQAATAAKSGGKTAAKKADKKTAKKSDKKPPAGKAKASGKNAKPAGK